MIEHLLLALIALLVAAKLGGALAERFGQPAVLGELLAGVLVGALPLVGFKGLAFMGTDPLVDALADLGVILLLFATSSWLGILLWVVVILLFEGVVSFLEKRPPNFPVKVSDGLPDIFPSYETPKFS